MFGDVNEKVGTIAAEVGQTPQGWNAGIFNMIRSLSENVIVPIAGLVITYVLCVELPVFSACHSRHKGFLAPLGSQARFARLCWCSWRQWGAWTM